MGGTGKKKGEGGGRGSQSNDKGCSALAQGKFDCSGKKEGGNKPRRGKEIPVNEVCSNRARDRGRQPKTLDHAKYPRVVGVRGGARWEIKHVPDLMQKKEGRTKKLFKTKSLANEITRGVGWISLERETGGGGNT